jgi:hypothetical protein
VQDWLSDIEQAYNFIYSFESTTETLAKSLKASPFAQLGLAPFFELPTIPLRPRRYTRWPPSPEEVRLAVSYQDRLRLSPAKLKPGFWGFIGAVNPLETIRQYLSDRLGRKKDCGYRGRAEAERLAMESEILKTKMLAERIALLKELGYRDREMAPLVNALVLEPLDRLGRHQDREEIGTAEIVALP